MSIITLELLNIIRSNFKIDWNGVHGISHFHNVFLNGQVLSKQEGINEKIVQFFSIFHDSQRENEHQDPMHGQRGALLAKKHRELLSINDEEVQLLIEACNLHTAAKTHQNATVAACFDSDRLDLWRVGKIPEVEFLSTPMAKLPETINEAYKRSWTRELPENAFGIEVDLLS